MPCQFVIHAVGPIWRDGESQERELLHAAVSNTIKRAVELAPKIEEKKHRRVCIPAISSAIFGFPVELCCKFFAIATTENIDGMSDEQ